MPHQDFSNGGGDTILSTLHDHYHERPDHTVLSWVDSKCKVTQTLTYGQLWELSGAVADLLEAQGLKVGDRVMIAYPFGLDFLAGLFGCMRAGIVPCSVYPPNPNKLKTDIPVLVRQAKDAGAVYVLTSRKYQVLLGAKMAMFLGTKKPDLKWLPTDNLRPSSTREDSFFASPQDIAFIQYTSGSTGFPKGVIISHESLLGNVHQYTVTAIDDHNLKAALGFVVVSWLPQYHDMGLIGTFMTSIYAGFSAFNASPLDFIQKPLLWHDMIQKFGGQATQGPNFAFGLVMKRMRQANITNEKWTSIQTVCIGSEPISPQVFSDLTDFLGISKPIVGYGMAEVGLFASSGSGRIRDGVVACGPAEGGFSEIRIVDDKGQVVNEDGVDGEIWVLSPVVASGYWGQPQLTKETFCNTLENEDGECVGAV